MSSQVPDRTLEDLDFARILTRLAHHARTSLGEEQALQARFYSNLQRATRELALTSEMRKLLDAGNPPPLAGIRDIKPILAHAARGGVLEAADLLQIADTARGIWLCQRYLEQREEDSPLVAEFGVSLPDLEGLHEELYDSFADDGTLADHASEALGKLRSRRRTLHDRIRVRIRQMLNEKGVEEHLIDTFYTVREDRYVLPVRSGERAEVEGIIHGNSHSGRTLFIEPAELVSVNNELKLCEQAVAVEEHRILAELTRKVAHRSDDLKVGLAVIAELDVVQARGRLGEELDAVAPVLSTDGLLRLKAARNPLLLLRGIPVIPNDLELGGDRRFMVVTGPNAGGKTVTLSTLGLCALMAQAGMHVPAGPDSSLPLYANVLTVLGDNQDLQQDLSTFSGHVVRLKAVLEAAGDGTLVLLDELAAGTSPGQGAALAIAVLEDLADRGAAGAVSTHFERLKTLSLGDPRFTNAAVAMDMDAGEPTYELRMGLPGSSSGLEIALKMGLSPNIVSRARQVIGDPAQNVERILQRLDGERVALETERLALAEARKAAEAEQKALQAQRKRMDAEGEALVRAMREEALAELEIAREAIRKAVRDLQKEPNARNVQRRRVQLNTVAEKLGAPVAKRSIEPVADPDALPRAEAITGAAVHVASLNRDGVITAVRGNKAEVSVGTIRTRVKISELLYPKSKAVKRAPRRAPVDTSDSTEPPRSIDNTCDVRGTRMDEALAKVESYLDNALLSNRNAVFVLHGHGTGALRQGLREYFKGSPYVSRYEAAAEPKGGQAVTLVWLK